MIMVGITGGIGSGKTSVCTKWAQLGAFIINADDLAKQLMNTDPQVKQEIVTTFGEGSYSEDGSLNRKYLADQAFEKGRVSELNAIVHPRMPQAAEQEMKKVEDSDYKIVVYEAALLLENLDNYSLDYIVLVLADEQQRLGRVQQRDGNNAADIKSRMKQQQNFEKATDIADYTITNNGSLKELEQEAEIIYEQFK